MKKKIKQLQSKNKFFKRIIYIAYRICAFFYTVLFLICRIFPIRENKIVGCNMKGKRYGDNPKYILDEIIRQGLGYEMIWLMKDKSDADLPKEIRLAAYNPFSIAYHLSTAKVWIDSNMKEMGIKKRPGQYYIQTWHGTPLKKVALDMNTSSRLIDEKLYPYNAKLEDAMISNGRMITEIYRKAFEYKGKVLECGAPRNDIFFENANPYKEKIKTYYQIENQKIALYAPTFRDDFRIECLYMDFNLILDALQKRFGGEWVILVRLHPQNIRDAAEFISYSDLIINATDYNVMQELLAASDILITDYSSSMFDFSTNGKTCFLYATDIEQYADERGMYFDIMSLPYPVASNSEELAENISMFDEAVYQKNLQNFFEKLGMCDNGTACRQVVAYIQNLH